jgi:uncharacterized protein YbjT (DUF2867 family)
VVQPVPADINDASSIRVTVTGAFGVVNAVSLYVERGNQTFQSVHVDAAARLARIARECGVARFIHVSGVGADAHAHSPYIRSRGEGEAAVRAAFPAATIVRPCVMFGPDDAFFVPLAALVRRLPIIPLFERGQTLLQPSYVGDVAEAIARIVQAPQPAAVYELGGRDQLSYEAVLRAIAAHLGVRRAFVPMPFGAWNVLAFCSEMLPQPLITRNQIDLMRLDNVASPALPGFRELGIEPQGIERALTMIG